MLSVTQPGVAELGVSWCQVCLGPITHSCLEPSEGGFPGRRGRACAGSLVQPLGTALARG